MKKFAVLLFLTTVGCGESPLESYNVYLAPGFSSQQEANLLDVMGKWESAEEVYGLKFHIYHGISTDPSGSYTIYPLTTAQIHYSFGAHVGGHTEWCNYSRNDGEMYLPTDNDELFVQIAAHEYGHLLGLQHTGFGTLMSLWTGNQPNAITCADQKQFADIRGEHVFFCDGDVGL